MEIVIFSVVGVQCSTPLTNAKKRLNKTKCNQLMILTVEKKRQQKCVEQPIKWLYCGFWFKSTMHSDTYTVYNTKKFLLFFVHRNLWNFAFIPYYRHYWLLVIKIECLMFVWNKSQFETNFIYQFRLGHLLAHKINPF